MIWVLAMLWVAVVVVRGVSALAGMAVVVLWVVAVLRVTVIMVGLAAALCVGVQFIGGVISLGFCSSRWLLSQGGLQVICVGWVVGLGTVGVVHDMPGDRQCSKGSSNAGVSN